MYSLTLQNAGGDNVITSGDVLGRISFAVPSESDGTAATYIASQIYCQAEGSFTSASNPASVVISTSSPDSAPATGRLKISQDGHFVPMASGQYDIGSTANIFRNAYVNTGNIDVVSFNIDTETALTKGQISWDDTQGTIDIGLTDNTTIHVGEHRLFRVRNTTGDILYKGQVVYATGVHSNGIITPNKYIANGTVRENRFMGVVLENINNNSNGYVIDFGHIEELDLDGSATNYAVGDETWLAGDILYVHPTVAGKLTKNEPKHSISVAIILDPGNGNGNGRMFVRPTSYGHLNDNHDVEISGVTNGQFLQYNAATDYWVPSSSGNFIVLQVNGIPIPTGVGTNNYVTKWTGTHSLGTGILYDDGTNVGVGTSSPSSKLDVSGVITAVSGNSNNWNTAYSWGDHSISGYLTDISSQNIQDLNNVINDFSYPLLINENILIYDSGISAFKGSSINLGLIRQGSIPLTGYNTSYLGYYIRMNNGEFTVNEQGANLDFRVEGDSNANLLFTDASTDRVGIGTSTPSSKFQIVGDGGTSDSGILTISDPNGGSTTSWIKLYADDGFGDLTWHVAYSDTTVFKTLEFRTSFGSVSEVNIEPSGEFWVLNDKSVYTYRYLSDKTRFNTVSQPAYSWSTDEDTGMFSPTGDAIAFSAGGVERMRIDTNQVVVHSGNVIFNDIGGNFDFRVEGDADANLLFTDASTDRVGIGTSAPSQKLHVAGNAVFDGVILADDSTSTSLPVYSFVNDTNCGIAHPVVDTLAIVTAGTEKFRFTSDGKFLGGSTVSRTAGPAVHPVFQFEGTTAGSTSYQCIAGSTTSTVSPQIILARHRGAVGESTIVSDGDSLGLIRFNGGDGTDCVSTAAQIECRVDGTPGVNDMPGSLRFSTTSDGFQAAGERMRITSAGLVGIATTAPTATLDVNADTMRLRTARTPASGTATGNAGDICWDSNYLYVCVATNTWKRLSLASW